jgi:hypothetical protein
MPTRSYRCAAGRVARSVMLTDTLPRRDQRFNMPKGILYDGRSAKECTTDGDFIKDKDDAMPLWAYLGDDAMPLWTPRCLSLW